VLTAASLVFDWDNSTFLPPINGIWQCIPDTWRVTIARGPSQPPLRVDPGSQVPGPVLLVGQIREPVQSQPVGSVIGVCLVDESQVVFEDLKPLILLPERVVQFAVLHEPLLVQGLDLLLGAPRGLVPMSVVVGDYGHVQG